LPPDLVPDAPHPTAGAAIVGARGPLVAYNVNLNTPDVEVARAIARRIRQERGRRPELDGVRALGLSLASRGCAQVSMNLTRPERSPLPAVFAFVREEAARLGADAAESEVIGVLPRASLGGQSPQSILWHAYRPAQILETWLP
jgi:glutamate formiminotransferase